MVVPVKNIYQRINQVMTEVEAVQKENKKVNGQYTFVSHDGVAKALHMPLVRAGIVIVPSIEELIQDGNRTLVKMVIGFINIDNPEDRLVVSYQGYGIDTQDKGIGKAISYAVKYALLKVFCLETGDDVEKGNIEYDSGTKSEPAKLSLEQVDEILKLIGSDKDRLTKILSFFGVKDLQEIAAESYQKIILQLKKKPSDKVTPMVQEAAAV